MELVEDQGAGGLVDDAGEGHVGEFVSVTMSSGAARAQFVVRAEPPLTNHPWFEVLATGGNRA